MPGTGSSWMPRKANSRSSPAFFPVSSLYPTPRTVSPLLARYEELLKKEIGRALRPESWWRMNGENITDPVGEDHPDNGLSGRLLSGRRDGGIQKVCRRGKYSRKKTVHGTEKRTVAEGAHEKGASCFSLAPFCACSAGHHPRCDALESFRDRFPLIRQIRYSFSLRNTTNHPPPCRFLDLCPRAEKLIPGRLNLEVSHPYRLVTDQYRQSGSAFFSCGSPSLCDANPFDRCPGLLFGKIVPHSGRRSASLSGAGRVHRIG